MPQWQQRSTIEICAGIGGLASGAECIEGVQHLGLVELWPPACARRGDRVKCGVERIATGRPPVGNKAG